MNYESILIVTYGRTGSTLLMGLLNAIPGVLIRGENMNFCFNLYKAWQALKATQKNEKTTEPTHPFFGGAEMDESKFILDAQNLLKRQLVPNMNKEISCWGFKEVRYLPSSMGGAGLLGGYLDFLNVLMPKPAFIILTRNHDDVLDSGFWKKQENKASVRKKLADFEKEASSWLANKKNAFHIDYDDIVSMNNRLQALYEFLGTEYDSEIARRVIEKPHSYDVKPGRVKNSLLSLDVEYAESDAVETIAIDANALESVRQNVPLDLHGVVVIKSDISSKHALVVCDAAGEHTVTWGLESPEFAKMYSDNPHAAHARFKVQGLCVVPEHPIELHLLDKSGHREAICRLSVPNRPIV